MEDGISVNQYSQTIYLSHDSTLSHRCFEYLTCLFPWTFVFTQFKIKRKNISIFHRFSWLHDFENIFIEFHGNPISLAHTQTNLSSFRKVFSRFYFQFSPCIASVLVGKILITVNFKICSPSNSLTNSLRSYGKSFAVNWALI